MALVKFTQETKNSILSSIKEAYLPRLAAIDKLLSNALTFTDIVCAYIQETGGYELYEKTAHWMKPESSFYVSSLNNSSLNNSSLRGYYSFSEEDPHPEGFSFASRLSNQNPRIPEIPSDLNLSSLQPKIDLVIELAAKKELIRGEVSAITDSMRLIFNAYKTVNEALKNHPEIESILPQRVKDEVSRVVAKREKVIKEQLTINLDGLKMVTVLNAFNGAIKNDNTPF